jgi:hypothetical protein
MSYLKHLVVISTLLITAEVSGQIWPYPGLAGTSWESDEYRIDFMTIDDTIRVYLTTDTLNPILKGVGRRYSRYIPFIGVGRNNIRIQQTPRKVKVKNGMQRWVIKHKLLGVRRGAMYIEELEATEANFKIKSRRIRTKNKFSKR